MPSTHFSLNDYLDKRISRKVTKNAFNSCVLTPLCINNLHVTTSLSIFIYILLYLQRGLVGGRILPNIFYLKPKRTSS